MFTILLECRVRVTYISCEQRSLNWMQKGSQTCFTDQTIRFLTGLAWEMTGSNPSSSGRWPPYSCLHSLLGDYPHRHLRTRDQTQATGMCRSRRSGAPSYGPTVTFTRDGASNAMSSLGIRACLIRKIPDAPGEPMTTAREFLMICSDGAGSHRQAAIWFCSFME